MSTPHFTARARAALAIASVAALSVTSLPSASAAPEVTPKDVENLFHEAEGVTEEVNYLSDLMNATESEISNLSADIKRDQSAYDEQKEALSSSIVAQQMDSPLGPTAELLTSGDTQSFLDGLGAIQALNSNQADQLENFSRSNAQLEKRRAQLEDRKDSLADTKADADAKKDKIQEKHDEAERALAELDAKEQEEFNAPSEVKEDPEASEVKEDPEAKVKVSASGKGGAAIEFARQQLGEPYNYGSAGPSSWDCSGLTSKAFAAAGVTIPRSSKAQAGSGTSVSRDSLKPGDLVFYYSPISHVGIYMGDGKLIHAPRSGKNVEIVDASSMPFNSARRVG